jgi:hypothetical protein
MRDEDFGFDFEVRIFWIFADANREFNTALDDNPGGAAALTTVAVDNGTADLDADWVDEIVDDFDVADDEEISADDRVDKDVDDLDDDVAAVEIDADDFDDGAAVASPNDGFG